MRFWYQDLNKDEKRKRLFYFRGSVGSNKRDWFRYEFASGPSCKLRISDDDGALAFSFGLIFFTLYLTLFQLGTPKFMLGRGTGFYWYEWELWWECNQLKWESSSSDPWWRKGAIHFDEIFLGKAELIRDRWTSSENIEFELGGKKFVMDSIKWEKWRRFRRHIPYILYHRDSFHVDMEIKNPPLYSGKGENSWDCGDVGTYGLSMVWKHLPPSWNNRIECSKLAVDEYVKNVLNYAKRYGGSTSERGVNKESEYKYIGIIPHKQDSEKGAVSDDNGN